MVGLVGLEPTALSLSGIYSNQLSYRPLSEGWIRKAKLQGKMAKINSEVALGQKNLSFKSHTLDMAQCAGSARSQGDDLWGS